MTEYLIMCKSLTHAQRCVRLLERRGIMAAVTKAPQSLSNRGCTYAISLKRKIEEAVQMLRKQELQTGKIYRKTNGSYFEVAL